MEPEVPGSSPEWVLIFDNNIYLTDYPIPCGDLLVIFHVLHWIEIWYKLNRFVQHFSNRCGNAVPTAKKGMGTPFPVVPIGNEPCIRLIL